MNKLHYNKYIKYKLWVVQQYPDPDLIYKEGGIYAVISYLKSCPSPDVTKEILTHFGANIHPDAHSIGP